MRTMLPGFTLVDRSRYGNHGTLTGATWVQLPSGAWVLDFTAAANKVEVAANPSINDMPESTFEAWVYVAGEGGGLAGRIFDRNTNVRYFRIKEYQVEFSQIFTTQQGIWVTPGNSVPRGTWLHIQISYDNRLTTNDPVVCINGASKAITETGTPIGSAASDAASTLVFGNRITADRYLNGYMSPPRIYNYIRTPAQALEVYNREKAFYGL